MTFKIQTRREVMSHTKEDYLSTGSTLLNLACSGRPEGGFIKGHYYFIVGDSTSGNTFLSLTCLAEASINPHFDNYRFIYDGTEGGALMDIERFFGKKVAERLEPPRVEEGEEVFSHTTEEFYYHVDDALKKGDPFIYVLDSQDCLSSDPEVEKFDERKKSSREGKKASGSYGDAKAKIHSSSLRQLMGPLEKSGSILIVINQTRDSFDPFQPKTYSGGRALKFYATLEMWSSVKGQIEKTIRGRKRQLGVNCLVRVKKNRITGRDRKVVIPIYHSFGIDDVGSCVDYLLEEDVWKEKRGYIEVNGIGPPFKGRREKVIRRIEEEEKVEDLLDLVGQTWDDIEKLSEIKRKKRYDD